ncbi:MAG: DUF4438 domain-containing protein [bacterium]
MLRTNAERLVKISVIGEISSPGFGPTPYRISQDGQPIVLPGTGGITYNVKVGDLATGWEADHVEPGVSIKYVGTDERAKTANGGLNVLAQVGNEAVVVSGDAKGAKGVVTGKHGGIEHVLVDFPQRDLEKMAIGDKIMVKAFGTGFKLLDHPDIKVMNLDPELLHKMKIEENGDRITVEVTHKIPSAIMGSGLGASDCYRGDYDIQLFDKKVVEEYGLEDIRFGDFVAILDTDHSFGRVYITGAVSIGIVVHSNCVIAGHGPGVTTLLASREGKIEVKINPKANIANYLKIGTQRQKKR